MNGKKKITRLYLRRETSTRIDELKKRLSLRNNIDVIVRALTFLKPLPGTLSLPDTVEGHHYTTQRFSDEHLTMLDELAQRFDEGRGAVIDRAVFMLDKHARSIRAAELRTELASLTPQPA